MCITLVTCTQHVNYSYENCCRKLCSSKNGLLLCLVKHFSQYKMVNHSNKMCKLRVNMFEWLTDSKFNNANKTLPLTIP